MSSYKRYDNEYEGQIDFYRDLLPLIDSNLTMEDIIEGNTDGVVNGNLLEFKLSINDLNIVLFQAIKYLSQMRVKGKDLPANIILIGLNEARGYVYKTENYILDIEKVYETSASINNQGFTGGTPESELFYRKDTLDLQILIDVLKEKNICKYKVDENCIVGLAERYYRENKGATKIDLLGDRTGKVKVLGEIRSPNFFKNTIHPYTETTNKRMAYIMDKLNPSFMQKDLGAFFTPPETYGKKSRELVWEAIRRHQKSGNSDYIILDRCAGTGNLEMFLNDDVPEDIVDKDILSHCIINTFEYLEYKILHEKFSDKVRWIVPPVENEDTFMSGFVRGSNALSEEFINNGNINMYVENQDCTIIILENPPYTESSSIKHQIAGEGKKSSGWKNTKATIDAKSPDRVNRLKGAESNDMANVFIWSALEYYLRKPEDSIVVFSPMKYWKNSEWMNKKFVKGFGFNRRFFHTNQDTVVSCILWANEEMSDQDKINLDMFGIDTEKNKVEDISINREVKRVKYFYSEKYYDKRIFEEDEIETKNNIIENKKDYIPNAIWNGLDGTEVTTGGIRVQAKYNENIIAYLVAQSNTFEHPRTKTVMTRNAIYNGNGFFVRADNFLEKIPMFAAGWWSTYNSDWTMDGIIYRTGDGFEKFNRDLNNKNEDQYRWLNKVLFYTTLEYYTKIRSFRGSDNRIYMNELCLDNNISHETYTNNILREAGEKTLASYTLEKRGFFNEMDEEEKKLYSLWKKIIKQAKKTKEYDKSKNYGPFQIEQELNTYIEEEFQRKNKKIYDYPELNGDLNTLRKLIKNYYNNQIKNNLFHYEFLK